MIFKILIIEDEKAAYQNLSRMIEQNEHDFEILAWLKSVERSKEWLIENVVPDLIFLDVQLGDGLSFEIFENLEISCPIIFTTAYVEHAIKAFQYNSIDYLLKPFNQVQLNSAIKKFQDRAITIKSSQAVLLNLMQDFQQKNLNYKERFHVKHGRNLVIIRTEEIAWFCLENYIFLMTTSGKKYVLEYTLDQLQDLLNPNLFYRLNRQVIVNIKAIQKIETQFNYKLKVTLQPQANRDIFVSKEKTKNFKTWLG